MQQSFTKAVLCQMHLMILFDRIIDFLNKSSAVDLISLDFYSVFDTVTRLVKLQKTGISGIEQEMSGELQRVYFGKFWGVVVTLVSLEGWWGRLIAFIILIFQGQKKMLQNFWLR